MEDGGMSNEKSDIKQDQTTPRTLGAGGLPSNSGVSNTLKRRLLKGVVLVFVLFVFSLAGLHVAASLAVLNSYAKLFAGSYSEARSSAIQAQQLAALSPTLAIDVKKAIDQQVAVATASELPVNGIFSALMTNSLLGGKYRIPDQVTAEEIVRAVRHSNMRGDVGAASIINKKMESHLISLSDIDSRELEDEIAYDNFRSLIFSFRGRMANNHAVRAAEIDEKLTPTLTHLREIHGKSQSLLCTAKPYRCEINKIRWLVAECNYQRELSGDMDNKCVNSIRRAYLEAIGYPTRNDVIFDRCARRFGAHGCSAMAAELPFYMEALVIGYGSFKGE